ncbi:MAG TPA: Abi-alpha family protein [Pseudonocardia sp.]
MAPAGVDHEQGLAATWSAVVRDVRALAVDLTVAGVELARSLPSPPIDQVGAGWARIEDAVLREVKVRLAEVQTGPTGTAGRHGRVAPPTPAELLDDLLAASLDADRSRGRDELHRALLLRLVPDEARILAALADGTPYALVHVQSRAQGGRTVLSNASTVGRAAGVEVLDAVTTYVSHLRALGLAEEGAEDDSLAAQYDALLGDPGVRRAEDEARAAGRIGARVVRRTLRLSRLGAELWRACRPDDADTVPTTVDTRTAGASSAGRPSDPRQPIAEEPSDRRRQPVGGEPTDRRRQPGPLAEPPTAGTDPVRAAQTV